MIIWFLVNILFSVAKVLLVWAGVQSPNGEAFKLAPDYVIYLFEMY